MSLLDQVIDKVVEVAVTGRSRIVVCAAYGISCEGWLKVEIVRALSSAVAVDRTEILPEWQNIDLTIRSVSEKVLLQLKTFPTNYGRSGKPITNFIDGVAKDLAKLSEKRNSVAVGLAVWMAYPIPEPTPHTWPAHLAKVEAAAASIRRAERIPLWENTFARLYVMESK